MTKQYSGLTC